MTSLFRYSALSPVAVFTFLSSACVWPNVINGSVFSAGLAHMFEMMDCKKLNSMSMVDLLSHGYKDYRIPQKRKSSKVYEVERLIARREGAEVSKQIQREFSFTFIIYSMALFKNS